MVLFCIVQVVGAVDLVEGVSVVVVAAGIEDSAEDAVEGAIGVVVDVVLAEVGVVAVFEEIGDLLIQIT